jgi:NAD-dependent deacetylase
MESDSTNKKTCSYIHEAAALIRGARHLTAFTGAGISVESGIPPFRGPGGLWSKYDPRMLELDYFLAHPEKAWPVIREIFYDNFAKARPNKAHEVRACLGEPHLLKTLINTEHRQPPPQGRQHRYLGVLSTPNS